MRELITEKHGVEKCATTKGNKLRKAVDGIWGTLGVQIDAKGYLPFHTGFQSDHRLLWIRVSLAHIFGHTECAMRRPAARSLRMDDTRGQKIYNNTSSKYLKHHM
eukprot:9001148-Ditylum_brightwellii.AAC.1